MIAIRVNGEQRDIPGGTTVADLLSLLHVQTRYCAVELNRRVVPRETWPQVALEPGCELEIVTLTGGG
ncbi:MAG: sulfur carrier protein ThiS [Planctomycetota bacterium]